MIDFTNCEINKYKYYGGHNGNKICIKYNNNDYMLKFSPVNDSVKDNHEYSNSVYSEYISCHILESMGFNVQETILGKYRMNNNDKIVVACRDFTDNNTIFRQFAEFKNSQIEISKNGYGVELDEVLSTIESQNIFDVKILKEFFWDMFVADALLGNFDRHNGNWGFLINEKEEKIELAPIYDCASCLYPQMNDDYIKNVIDNEDELNARVYVFPNSALKINDKKINYFNYISSLENEDCNDALCRLYSKIDMNTINDIIDKTDFISDIRKDFYKKIINLRYEKLIKYNYDKLNGKNY